MIRVLTRGARTTGGCGIRPPALALRAGVALLASAVVAAGTARAQQRGLDRSSSTGTAAACTSAASPAPVTPTWAQRDHARRLVAAGHEAAIVGDYTTARDRFQEAAHLDPTSADIAYALARAYERTRNDAAAAREYCRYLALAPDSSEAGDVRSRIAALTPRNTPPLSADSGAVATRTADSRARALDPSVAFTSGLLPGVGQFYTHRPALGLAVLGAVVGATYWGIHSEQATHMRSYTDPNGYTFQYPVTARERPHLAAGIATASAITLLGALEAYLYARRDAGASPAAAGTAPPAQARSVRAAPMIAPGGVGMRLTVRVPFSIR
jgi:hypothetical protein